MPLIKKISIGINGSPESTSVYDIGAESNNVSYDNNTNIKDKIDSKQEALNFDIIPTENSENPVTSDGIATAINQLQTNFQAGVDSVYNACVDKGSTPASHALADVVQAIEDIESGGEYPPHDLYPLKNYAQPLPYELFYYHGDGEVIPANTGKYYIVYMQFSTGDSQANPKQATIASITNATFRLIKGVAADAPAGISKSFTYNIYYVVKTDETQDSTITRGGSLDAMRYIALDSEPIMEEKFTKLDSEIIPSGIEVEMDTDYALLFYFQREANTTSGYTYENIRCSDTASMILLGSAHYSYSMTLQCFFMSKIKEGPVIIYTDTYSGLQRKGMSMFSLKLKKDDTPVKPILKSKVITANGIYNASDDDCAGYYKVIAEMQPSVIQKSITQNGVYNASSDNVDGYSKVTVSVSGGSGTIENLYTYKNTGSNLSDSFSTTLDRSGKLVVALFGYVNNLTFKINGVEIPGQDAGNYLQAINEVIDVNEEDEILLSQGGSGATKFYGNIQFLENVIDVE